MVSRWSFSRWLRRVLLALLTLSLSISALLLLPGIASAHAEYVSSNPKLNAQLDKAPTTVSITFAEEVNPTGSEILVYDTDGKQVSTGTAQVDTTKQKVMNVPMQANGSEVYVVLWHNIALPDNHHTAGSFRFFVNISPMLKGMVANDQGGTAMNGQTGMANMASSTPGGDVSFWLAGVIAVIALLVGAGCGVAFARRSPASKQRTET